MAIATSGNGLELLHTKPVPRLGFAVAMTVIGASVYLDCFVGLEGLSRTPGGRIVKASLAAVNVGMGLLPLVCESARVFSDAMLWVFPFLLLSWQAAFVVEWALTGSGLLVWFWGPGFLVCIFLLAFRRRFFLVGFPLVLFVSMVGEVPLLCAMDPTPSQFFFEYDTYGECVLRGYHQVAVMFGSIGCFFLLLAVQQIANYTYDPTVGDP
ncbi:hypothetical protein T484DRAFT_1812977 [Baffinella frigidus]|nr:hypothetical protein T484DRAFT_1812977 [Cryptophyta sp. CCMP2293]